MEVTMEPSRSINIPLLVGGVAVALAAALFWYYTLPKQSATAPTDTLDTVPDVSAEVSGAVETPAEKLPETNPFSDYKNPFE
jgi:flagellar basal body-associated protein FliL